MRIILLKHLFCIFFLKIVGCKYGTFFFYMFSGSRLVREPRAESLTVKTSVVSKNGSVYKLVELGLLSLLDMK